MRSRKKIHRFAAEMKREHVLFLTSALVVVFAVFALFGVRQASLSPEVHFTDASKSGLAIVPASCPSSPDWTGSCDQPNYCSLTIDGQSSETIAAGQVSTITLAWDTDEAQAINSSYADNGASDIINPMITGIGAVYPQGTEIIAAPQSSVTYVYSGSYATGERFSCSAPVIVNNPPTYSEYANQVELYRSPGDPVTPGDTIDYRIYMQNTGDDQGDFTLIDNTPAGAHVTYQGGGTVVNPALSTSEPNSCWTNGGSLDGYGGCYYSNNPSLIWWVETPNCGVGHSSDRPDLDPYCAGDASGEYFNGYVDFHVQVDATSGQICNTPMVRSNCSGSSCGGTYTVNANTICNPVSPPSGTISLAPNPVQECNADANTVATVTVTANATVDYDVYAGSISPSTDFAYVSGGVPLNKQTGAWVTNGMVFYLVDHATDAVLNTATESFTQSGCGVSSPPSITPTCSANGTSVTLSWPSVSGATGYEPVVLLPTGSPALTSNWTNWPASGYEEYYILPLAATSIVASPIPADTPITAEVFSCVGSTCYGNNAASPNLTTFTCPSRSSTLCPDGSTPPTPGNTSSCTCAQGNASACSASCTLTPSSATLSNPGTVQLSASVSAFLMTSWTGSLSTVGNVGSGSSPGPWSVWAVNGTNTYSLSGTATLAGLFPADFYCSTSVTVGGSNNCALTCSDGSTPSGCDLNNCPAQQCTSTPVTYSCSPDTSTVYIQQGNCGTGSKYCQYWQAGYGCSGNSAYADCLTVPPPAIALFKVVPSLLHSGDTASVTWAKTPASQALDCTVTGSNGDRWSDKAVTVASVVHTTRPITSQATYTLNCAGDVDGTVLPPQAVTVNLIPNYQEQ